MAVTARYTSLISREGQFLDGPIAANVNCYQDAIVMRDSNGRLTNGATASGCIGVGVAESNRFTGATNSGTDPEVWNNTGGGASAFRVRYRDGVKGPFVNSGTSVALAMVGELCFIVDNVTVHATSNAGARSPAGLVYDVTSAGVFVDFNENVVRASLGESLAAGTSYTQTYSTVNRTVAAPTAVAPAAATFAAPATLTDNSGYSGTHNDTLAAVTLPPAVTENGGALGGAQNGDITALVDPAGDAGASLIDGVRECAAKINAILTQLAVMAQNSSDNAAKVIELVTQVSALATDRGADVTQINALIADDLDNRQTIGAVIDDLQTIGAVG